MAAELHRWRDKDEYTIHHQHLRTYEIEEISPNSLKSKNDIRLLYKIHLDSYSPVKYSRMRRAIINYDSKSIYVPSIEDIKIWDRQMLEVNKIAHES
jgi:hypothetical protein